VPAIKGDMYINTL